jgi:hypothetical protein
MILKAFNTSLVFNIQFYVLFYRNANLIIRQFNARYLSVEKPCYPHYKTSVENFPSSRFLTLFTSKNFLFQASIYFLHLQIEKTGQDRLKKT